jgi:hypothetical protein
MHVYNLQRAACNKQRAARNVCARVRVRVGGCGCVCVCVCVCACIRAFLWCGGHLRVDQLPECGVGRPALPKVQAPLVVCHLPAVSATLVGSQVHCSFRVSKRRPVYSSAVECSPTHWGSRGTCAACPRANRRCTAVPRRSDATRNMHRAPRLRAAPRSSSHGNNMLQDGNCNMLQRRTRHATCASSMVSDELLKRHVQHSRRHNDPTPIGMTDQSAWDTARGMHRWLRRAGEVRERVHCCRRGYAHNEDKIGRTM